MRARASRLSLFRAGCAGGRAWRALALAVAVLGGPARSLAAPEIDVDPPELIFSGVTGQVTGARSLVVSNTGTTMLAITSLSLTGAQPTAFQLVSPPVTPFAIAPGATAAVAVRFAPTTAGALSAMLRIASDDPDEALVDVGVYGLSAQGLEGGNEPPLQQVVTTLGHAIDVGGTALALGTGAGAIGQEVLLPLFEKAGAGDVRMVPVARYSPAFVLDFGYYLPNGASPTRVRVGQLSGSTNPPQHQTLFPALVSGGVAFDPGAEAFGLYTTGATHSAYSEDGLNQLLHPTNVRHAVRVYPLRDRAGVPVPNAYLVGFEEATNGDYQDYVFTLHNVRAPGGPVDDDGDGVSPPADCDDTDPAIFPGASEVCDGRDNDCDGLGDEGDPGAGGLCDTGLEGLCAAGIERCAGGVLVCVGGPPQLERCDGGLDEDCDGLVDEADDCELCPTGDTVGSPTQTTRTRIVRKAVPAGGKLVIKGTIRLPVAGSSRPGTDDVTVRVDDESGLYWEARLPAAVWETRNGRSSSYTDRNAPFERGGVRKAKLAASRDLASIRYVVKAQGLDLGAFAGARSTATVRIGSVCYTDTGDACVPNAAGTSTTCR